MNQLAGMDRPPSCKLFIVDATLGTREDDAEDQVLAAWPQSLGSPGTRDFSIVRLARASMALCSSFTIVRSGITTHHPQLECALTVLGV
jgi:hypothetical protein